MNAPAVNTRCSLQYLFGAAAVLILLAWPANAQSKKTSTPAPKAAAPAKSAPSGGAKPGGASTAAHGPTTSGGSHGPTTSNAGGTHGPTTSNPHMTTANAGHTTTANAGHTTTASTGHTTTTAGGTHTTTTGGNRSTTAGGTRGATGGTATNRMATSHSATASSKTMGGHTVPSNSHITRTANGSEVRTRANGRVADVHDARRGMDIHHGLNGDRRVSVERADHSRIMADRRGRGYVEHPYRYGGREFGHRTYYYHGRMYDHYYGHYYWHGAYMPYYTPAFYYAPAFYGWAYNPWVNPIAYSWGWAGNPWYAYYGFYFTPYPVYASASLWLTDYILSTTLAAAYQAQADANAAAQAQAAADAVALTDATKNLISAEVQRQIALENSEAQVAGNAAPDPSSSSIQRMLTDGVQHVFVAGSSLDVVNAQGQECAVSDGDALQLSGPPPADATAADLVMLSSKGGQECQQGATVSVSFTDLQEMQNHMRETIDQGMGDLQAKQGQGGLPALPKSVPTSTTKAALTSSAPPPDQNAPAEINEQAQAADQAENETVAQAGQGTATQGTPQASNAPPPIAPPPAPPTQISMGQTIDQVTAAMGNPNSIVDLGTKKIYVYSQMKITFKNGKVTDVQ